MKLTKYLLGVILMLLMLSGCSKVDEEQSFLFDDTEPISTAWIAKPYNTVTTTVTTTSTSVTTTTTTVVSTEKSTTSYTTVVRDVVEVIKSTDTETVVETNCETTEQISKTESCEEYQYYISETERVMLCNLVAREYGSDWVSVSEKAKVVAVVMNRVNSDLFPDTIYEVLTQPNQFSGYIPKDSYTSQVTDSVKESVDYYFNNVSEFGNYLYFEGDGTYNYFH